MPELPDVEVFRRHLAATSLHQKIKKTSVSEKRILEGVSAQALGRRLKDHTFESTRRHGKYLFVEVNGGGWLLLHFGMTGYVQYLHESDEAPEHTRVEFEFAGGERLAYVSQRLLGRVSFTEDADEYIREKELGPDALSIGLDEFRRRIGEKSGSLKPALMDQEALAGVGNVYSDEILFQLRLHPKTPVDHLDDKQVKALHGMMHRVLETAIKHHVDPDKMPRSYLLPHREDLDECPRCGGPLKKLKVSGRSAIYCPHCQTKDGKG